VISSLQASTTKSNAGVAILNTSAPFSSQAGKEALDVALIFGSFEQDISLFFHGEGVWQLLDDQHAEIIDVKNYLKTFSAFEFYDIDTVFVCEQSLKERNLNNTFHIEDVTVLNPEDFSVKLSQHQQILRF
jgi:tRNA 2-thiouridine synthesizing protein C|tara:strand:- start:1776 stop:2168 length:393 start_codon:yes stop_codon:yes gene_type:complete